MSPEQARGEDLDVALTPDRAKIVFSGLFFGAIAVRVLDMKTHQASTLPGSEGLYSPRWSPDERYIAAMPADHLSVMLYDFKTQHWADLATGGAGSPNWEAA